MSQTKDFRITTGNVIRDPNGSMWIVTDVNDYGDRPTISAVSFDSENCSATQQLDDHEDSRSCTCFFEYYDGDYEKGGYDPDCDSCKGTGRYTVKIKGWRHSKVLAPNAKAFIMSGVKKAFRLS